MKFTVLTLFPQMVDALTAHGLVAQACARGQIEIATLNPRGFTTDVHQTVDDRTFGGADGMVMKVEPLAAAIESLRAVGPLEVAVLSPQGRRWDQSAARAKAARGGHLALVCGRYAGIDHRFTVAHANEEISLGDFVLNGGELAACAVIESIARLRPGVLGNARSAIRDSFDDENLLECPQFTRPREAAGLPVPAPLLSGHHAEIQAFERAVSLVRTALLRPDLGARPSRGDLGRLRALAPNDLRALGLTLDQLAQLEKTL